MSIKVNRLVAAAALAALWIVPSSATESPVIVEWVQRYVAQGYQTDDYATAIATDSEGNVIVTGGSYGWDSEAGKSLGDDYATIKYDTKGNVIWERRYNGPANTDDRAYEIAVDANDNVIVTGESIGDYLTLKYDRDGNLLWERRYNGPKGMQDTPRALRVDANGNVVVTGRSVNGTDYYGSVDYATVKYGPDGQELWVRRFSGPGTNYDEALALAIDSSGNVLVSGESYGGTGDVIIGDDVVTLKYDPAGTLLWKRRFDGAAHSRDGAMDLVVDANDNVIVTGITIGVGTDGDFLTLKYGPNGSLRWARTFDAANSSDWAYQAAVDRQGDVVVIGCSTGTDSTRDFETIKYAPNGDLLWERSYSVSQNTDDWAYAGAVDRKGNVFVTGRGGGTSDNYLTVKYGPAGDVIWTSQYKGISEYSRDNSYAIALDAEGNAFVTGSSGIWAYGSDYATLKLASAHVETISLSPLPHTGGTPLQGTVTLNGPAPTGGVSVGLTSRNPSLASVPASVSIAEGSTSVNFSVTTTPVVANTVTQIVARVGAISTNVQLTVRAPTVASLSLEPTEVVGGSSSTGTLTLTGPAPAGGVVVALSSDRPKAVVPATVTVPEGASSTTFTVQTSAVLNDQTAKIKATFGSVSRVAYLRIVR